MDEDIMIPRFRLRSDSCPSSPRYSPRLSSCSPEDWNIDNPVLPLLTLPEEMISDNNTAQNKISEPSKKTKAKKESKTKVKQVFKTISEDEIKKELRAEKNRQFARESRIRKQQFVEQLQAEIAQLRQQVEIYKYRLSKYELIEKYCDLSIQGCFAELDLFHKKFDNSLKEEALKQRHEQLLEEREHVLEMLTRKLIEATFPIPARITLWLNDNNFDFHNVDKIKKLVAPYLTTEQLDIFSGSLTKMMKDKKSGCDNKEKIMNAWKEVRLIMNEIVISERKLQAELRKMAAIGRECAPKDHDPRVIEIVKQAMMHLALRPEIVNYGEWTINNLRSDIEKSLEKDDKTLTENS